MNREQAADIVRSLKTIGDSASKIGASAENIETSAAEIAAQARRNAGPLRTIAAASWAGLLGRMTGRC
jgi:methyl-accepting chemotaxis protein